MTACLIVSLQRPLFANHTCRFCESQERATGRRCCWAHHPSSLPSTHRPAPSKSRYYVSYCTCREGRQVRRAFLAFLLVMCSPRYCSLFSSHFVWPIDNHDRDQLCIRVDAVSRGEPAGLQLSYSGHGRSFHFVQSSVCLLRWQERALLLGKELSTENMVIRRGKQTN